MRMNATYEWVKDLSTILNDGYETQPRNQDTLELLAFQSVIDMKYPIIHAPERKLGYKFMAAEAAWILGGDHRVETIAPYSREIAKFSDDGQTFFGAYGPKVMSQLGYVVQTLAKDPDSRQAVINIWRENPPKTKDVPCTISVQWVIRNNLLHCLDTMRSSDLWLGHPYDVFNFSLLSSAVAIMLRDFNVNVELGALILTAGSKHLYLRDRDKAIKVIEAFNKSPETAGCAIENNPHVFASIPALTERLWQMANSPEGTLNEDLWR